MGQDTNPFSRNAAADSRSALQWPPPGLERIHGAVWPVNLMFGVGGALMALPFLWVLSWSRVFWSASPMGDAWWVPGIVSLGGALLVLAGLVRASQLGVLAARGAANGYDGRTLADVACDASRDAGFLMQGVRQYGGLDERERRRLLDARIVAAIGTGAALLWISVAFTIGIVLAARGVVHGVGPLLLLILVPHGIMLCVGLGARAFDETMSRRARQAWRRELGKAQARLEAEDWMRSRAARTGSIAASATRPKTPRVSAIGFGALALALPVPVVLLAFLSVAGPLVTKAAIPRATTMASRVARTEVLRPYALPADPSISPTDAGESLRVLEFVGRPVDSRTPVEREPVRVIDEPWAPADARTWFNRNERLAQRVYGKHEPLTTEEQAWLERMAAHPGHAEFARLARAGSADIVSTRWHTDRFTDTNAWELPVIRFGHMRQGAYAHIAIGLLAAQQGDLRTAETRFREVISTGLLLVRDGPTLIDMLVGSILAQEGADALRLFYEATGRDADAAGLRLAVEAVDRAESAARSLQPRTTGTLQGLVSIAQNPDLPPGLRWESLRGARLTASCQSTRAILFGEGEAYDAWLRKVNGSLVRFPSDQALFDLLGSSAVPAEALTPSVKLIRGLYGLTFGSAGPAASCAGFATAVASAY